MKLDEAKRYLGDRWVLSPNYRRQLQHSPYHAVDVSKTIRRAMTQYKPVPPNTVTRNIVRLGRDRTGSGG
jgi:hypothetical protein